MKSVLVTGAMGQLGMCIQQMALEYEAYSFVFKDSRELDITDKNRVNSLFNDHTFAFCINCAAYTNVDKAEKDPKSAFAINAEGARNLALACQSKGTVLIHISTDYVFDGAKQEPYGVNDAPNPINQYGKSKLLGERHIQNILKHYYIVRTSWLYSEYGKNFYKTIVKKAKKGEPLIITDDQMGCPTNANHLVRYIISLLTNNKPYGIYHFADSEVMTWYGFAKKILDENYLLGKVKLEKVKNYRTFARRPKYSVLKTTKVE